MAFLRLQSGVYGITLTQKHEVLFDGLVVLHWEEWVWWAERGVGAGVFRPIYLLSLNLMRTCLC